MGLLRKLLGRKPKSPPPTGPSSSSSSSMPSNFITPDPFASEAQFEAVKAHMLESARRDPARFKMIERMAAFQSGLGWLESNFPPETHEILIPGPFPDAFPGPLNGPGLEHVTPEDTRIYVVRKKDVAGPQGIVMMQLVVFAGSVMGLEDGDGKGRYIGTPAMDTAVAAFLGLLRRMVDAGALRECTAVVGMGMDMTIYHFTPERGFFDPPEGFAFEKQRVDLDREGILPEV
ncbi:hypothetical protein QBC47DRAFT_168613 [Echria macrotheca]|uniref:Uncharacterized protein n=1 Tax=Echria macrotheca TaxID=438768 RepID=A0AAJ0FAV3_9PEZI|nr:hypothetical protein QBC47DRAFT_168613 [Echria macrotheca]